MTTLELLRQFSLCENFSPEALLELGQLCHTRSFSAGTYLLRQGDVARDAYAIVTGQVAAEKHTRKMLQIFSVPAPSSNHLRQF